MTNSIKDLGSNIIKLEGYGVYVTMLDFTLYTSAINDKTGGPTLDPDSCIIWDALADPPNQEFLNITNEKFGLNQLMTDYGGHMSMKDIRSYIVANKSRKENAATGNATVNAAWTVKNLKEKEK